MASQPKKSYKLPAIKVTSKKVPKPSPQKPEIPKEKLKVIKAKLRETLRAEKNRTILHNKQEIQNHIENLPKPGSTEYGLLDQQIQSYVTMAFHRAESSTRFLIIDSELSSNSRFELCNFFMETFSEASFSELVMQLCDVWKHLKDSSKRDVEGLFVKLCEAKTLKSSQKLKFAILLYNSGNFTSVHECLRAILEDPESEIGDRVEACKFLITSEESEDHDLAQESLSSIIEDPRCGELGIVEFLDQIEGSEYEDGSRSSASEITSSEEESSEENSVPSFLEDSDSEIEEKIPKIKTHKKVSKVPKDKKVQKEIEQKLKEDRAHEDFTKRRYSLITDFLSKKAYLIEEEGRKKRYYIPAIKTSLNREKLEPAENLDLLIFMLPIIMLFINNPKNHHRQRILASANVYGNSSVPPETQKEVFEYLLSVAKNTSLIEDLRADALDVIFRLSKDSKNKQMARKMLMDLGAEAKEASTIANKVKTIYQNSQNIHDDAISEAVLNFINKIDLSIDLYSFDEITKELSEIYRKLKISESDKHKARAALYRCSIDNALFGDDLHTVKKIFCYVWTQIQNIGDADTIKSLEQRFVEALVEMGDTCTTGHVDRLVQVLEGHGVELKISWKDQIISNVSGRISAVARGVEDPKLREIIDIGILEDADPKIRELYLKWVRAELLKLETTLWKEFKEYVKRSDFDDAYAEAALQFLGKT
jgi:hypothetical protein